MLKNYLTTALRNLSRNKVYSVLNIVGLALGIGCAFVIYKVILFENSFDRHQEHYSDIYRIVTEDIRPDRLDKGMGTPQPMAAALREYFPEVKHATRVHYIWPDQYNVRKPDGTYDKFLLEEGVAFAENTLFDIFTFDWIAGDKDNALKQPNTAVISESLARKWFGLGEGEEARAIGKLINQRNKVDFEVVGVIKDPVAATNFPFHLLLEYEGQEAVNSYYGDGKNWNSISSGTNTYIIPGDRGFDPGVFEKKLIGFVEKYHGEGSSETRAYKVQPLADIHFDDEYDNYTYSVKKVVLIALVVIGIFLIITACINFINLATAQAANRAREIGIRKALGGYRSQLQVQFLTEIALITFFAILIALAVSEFMFIQLEDIIGHRLHVDLFDDPWSILFLLGLFLLVSLLSGFYPSVLLARMNVVLALKNRITGKKHSGGLSLRKTLVIAQFAISQFLIIGTIIIAEQMDYFTTKDLGFQTEAIISTYLPEPDEVKRERFRNLMMSRSFIADVSFSLAAPTGNSNSFSSFNYAPLGSEDDYHGNFKCVDERYIDFYGLQLLAGKGLAKGDSIDVVVINQRIADLMGFGGRYEEVIGETLTSGFDGDKKVIGVVEDFHSRSLQKDMDFVFLLREPKYFQEIAFKVAANEEFQAAIQHFERTWEAVYPEYVVQWSFYDEQLAERYEREKNISMLMRIFSTVSILIGCLGLYGLISFVAQNRTKEIGIRKVLGASVVDILSLFIREVVILVAVAFVLAAPAAYFILNRWLDHYVFRIEIGLGFFVTGFIATLLIAFVTVSHRTISSALLNPATTLKDE